MPPRPPSLLTLPRRPSPPIRLHPCTPTTPKRTKATAISFRPLPPLPHRADLPPTTLLRGWPTPFKFPGAFFVDSVPAIRQWFVPPSSSEPARFKDEWLKSVPGDITVPLEITSPEGKEFSQANVPLEIFLQSLSTAPGKGKGDVPKMYLAQYPLLTNTWLRGFFEPPPAPLNTWTGQIHPTLWLGLASAATSPLHADPSANVFVQLCGTKRIRLLRPDDGEKVLRKPDKIRGVEMMVGAEKEEVERIVWAGGKVGGLMRSDEMVGWEVSVGRGEGVFIPKGWWHAVRSLTGEGEKEGEGEGGVSASVNWWL